LHRGRLEVDVGAEGPARELEVAGDGGRAVGVQTIQSGSPASPSRSSSDCPRRGQNAVTYPVWATAGWSAGSVMTIPPYEWPTSTTGSPTGLDVPPHVRGVGAEITGPGGVATPGAGLLPDHVGASSCQYQPPTNAPGTRTRSAIGGAWQRSLRAARGRTARGHRRRSPLVGSQQLRVQAELADRAVHLERPAAGDGGDPAVAERVPAQRGPEGPGQVRPPLGDVQAGPHDRAPSPGLDRDPLLVQPRAAVRGERPAVRPVDDAAFGHRVGEGDAEPPGEVVVAGAGPREGLATVDGGQAGRHLGPPGRERGQPL